MNKIIPAILTSDEKDLRTKLKKLESIVRTVQIDIVDGKFADNKTIDIEAFKNIKTKLDLEAHLMVEKPIEYFSKCARYDFAKVIFHIEETNDKLKTFKEIEKYNFQKGIALNPETPIESIQNYLDHLQWVLILGVSPGFGGQKLVDTTFQKIEKLKNMKKDIKIEVDGGVNEDNIKKLKKTGADYFAVGSSIFKNNKPQENIKKLNSLINE